MADTSCHLSWVHCVNPMAIALSTKFAARNPSALWWLGGTIHKLYFLHWERELLSCMFRTWRSSLTRVKWNFRDLLMRESWVSRQEIIVVCKVRLPLRNLWVHSRCLCCPFCPSCLCDFCISPFKPSTKFTLMKTTADDVFFSSFF